MGSTSSDAWDYEGHVVIDYAAASDQPLPNARHYTFKSGGLRQ